MKLRNVLLKKLNACKLTAGVALTGLLINASAGLHAAESAAPISKPHGIFISGGQFQSEKHLNQPFVDGTLLRPRWREIEPSPGKYDWSVLDAEIAKVKKAGKLYTLGIVGGPSTPEWVFKQKGVKAFEYSFHNPHAMRDRSQPQIMPIPWDAAYLRLWQDLIAEAGKRYGDDPSLYLVHITGSTQNGFEMQLPQDRSRGRDSNVNIPDWNQYGYSKAKIIGAWKTTIDSFVNAFPHKPLDLEIHGVLEDYSIPRELIAYGINRAPGRFGAFGAWLNNRQQPWDRPLRDIMISASGQSFCNYQLIGNETRQAERMGSGGLKGVVELGMSHGCYYYEIWEADIKNPGFHPWFTQLQSQLKDKAQRH